MNKLTETEKAPAVEATAATRRIWVFMMFLVLLTKVVENCESVRYVPPMKEPDLPLCHRHAVLMVLVVTLLVTLLFGVR